MAASVMPASSGIASGSIGSAGASKGGESTGSGRVAGLSGSGAPSIPPAWREPS